MLSPFFIMNLNEPWIRLYVFSIYIVFLIYEGLWLNQIPTPKRVRYAIVLQRIIGLLVLALSMTLHTRGSGIITGLILGVYIGHVVIEWSKIGMLYLWSYMSPPQSFLDNAIDRTGFISFVSLPDFITGPLFQVAHILLIIIGCVVLFPSLVFFVGILRDTYESLPFLSFPHMVALGMFVGIFGFYLKHIVTLTMDG
ncbi:MAG: hypothetical protein LRY46_00240 [Candidatus Pacebacteria bacterium]|nr:hypothetical protein [Candidatus Paceibacterota bacterium]